MNKNKIICNLSHNIHSLVQSTAGQKRRLQDEDKEDVMTVYDKPYIGQHDQGIQYQHPLKRIKKC